VTRYLLDTNILSDATKPKPSPHVAAWLQGQDDNDLFISTLTLAEIRKGILEKDAGRKRRELENWFSGPDGPRAQFQRRILPFDEASAIEWARIMAEGTSAGRPRSALDMIIAATATAHDCTVVTLNERHFQNVVSYLNPAYPD
jgi:predicted nucleic acid-binding protein